MRNLGWVLVAAVAAASGGCSDDGGATPVDAAVDAVDAAPVCTPTCSDHATCEVTGCRCQPGWMGDGVACADVDECAANNGGCAADADCTNTPGGRTCACRTGFLGDGVSCHPIWQQVGHFPGVSYLPGGGDALAAAIGDTVYLALDRGIGASFFRSFDTTTHQLSQPLDTSIGDFCQCGYGQILVASGPSLYMFGNAGARYDVAGNAWTTLPGFTAADVRGEAGGAVDPATGRIYAVGGRDGSGSYVGTTASIATTGAVTAEPGNLGFGWRAPSAYIIPGTTALFAAGGLPDDGNPRHLRRHALGSATWDELADAPGDLAPDRGIGHVTATLLWVGTDAGLYLYDVTAGTWRPQPLAVPPNFQRAVSAAGHVWAITSTGSELGVYQLLATE